MNESFLSTLWPDLRSRLIAEELMDDPHSDRERLERTLRQFAVINRLLSRTPMLVRRLFIADMCRDRERAYTVLDMGSGAGDFARWLSRECEARGVRVTIHCVDSDPRVAAFARTRCEGYANIETVERDVRDMLAGDRRFDYVYANHFLHHLDHDSLVHVLPLIDRVAVRGVLLNDIARSRRAYLGYTVLAALLFRGSFAFTDGRLSVRRSFTPTEVRRLVARAGLAERLTVATCFPSRVYVWRTRLHDVGAGRCMHEKRRGAR